MVKQSGNCLEHPPSQSIPTDVWGSYPFSFSDVDEVRVQFGRACALICLVHLLRPIFCGWDHATSSIRG